MCFASIQHELLSVLNQGFFFRILKICYTPPRGDFEKKKYITRFEWIEPRIRINYLTRAIATDHDEPNADKVKGSSYLQFTTYPYGLFLIVSYKIRTFSFHHCTSTLFYSKAAYVDVQLHVISPYWLADQVSTQIQLTNQARCELVSLWQWFG